ncbi:hypothetical protein [Sphingobacterium griseoflavum]|uniref:Lipoprotein n=1 Tax=Sphingobacterium griseoflavum TaxID=1474952 RepID=A0ABQ3HQK1_9SPHI|nr:hypothetical protein [Sphingobacterium griseoflavum]GHE23538.1 hypothetical protein GCM10017764_05060 [Sphingobacterium griseoflavum]
MKRLPILNMLLGCYLFLGSCNNAQQDNKRPVSPRIDDSTHDAKLQDSVRYELIHDTDSIPGNIDYAVASQLKEPIQAMAAFYAAMGGSGCDGEKCKLTTALGLGRQGSDAHQTLITKYFPNDKVAQTVVEQDCYLRPSGASNFSDYDYLRITEYGDSVRVDYRLLQYSQGKETWTEGPDLYVLEDEVFHKVKRNLWTFVEK